jgi:hypothetical protein
VGYNKIVTVLSHFLFLKKWKNMDEQKCSGFFWRQGKTVVSHNLQIFVIETCDHQKQPI